MRRERLKDRIEDPPPSPFAVWINLIIVLLALGAVYVAIVQYRRNAEQGTHTACGCGINARHSCHLTLTAGLNGLYYWNRQGPFPSTDFPERFSAWLKVAHEPQVIVTAAPTASLGDATRLLAEVQRQGVSSVRFAAPATAPAPPSSGN